MLSNMNDMQKPFYKKVLAFNRQILLQMHLFFNSR